MEKVNEEPKCKVRQGHSWQFLGCEDEDHWVSRCGNCLVNKVVDKNGELQYYEVPGGE